METCRLSCARVRLPGFRDDTANISTDMRVHWCRMSAQKARWQEQASLSTEEMFRTLNSYRREDEEWKHKATECVRDGREGAAAYARRFVRSRMK